MGIIVKQRVEWFSAHRSRSLLCGLALLLHTAAGAQVSFSMPGGFYPEAFTLTLSAAEGLAIHYTTDGSTPTGDSPLYQQPLTLSPALYSTRDIFLMPDAPTELWTPPAEVRHAIVLRAAAFDSEKVQVGPVGTYTYFVGNLMGHPPQLPAVSIALDPEALFDPDSGIFSPNGWDASNDFHSGNFNQHGRDWERLANVEFYELDNQGFAQTLGLRVHGGKTRRIMQKPLKLYARQEYGKKKIQYPLFDEVSYTSFKRLVLKPFCAAWGAAGIQDLLASRIAHPLRFASMASRPVTLYINGEYWGIYYLQESPDERLVEQLDGVDAEEVNLIGSWLGLVENGNGSEFRRLMQWLDSADLADPRQYKQLCALIDIDNFIDYQLFEAFIHNNDWPSNNMRCYQHGTQPWRWFFYDGDGAFDNPDDDMYDILTYQGSDAWPSSAEATLCFRRLLASEPFLERLDRRLHVLTNTLFAYEHTAPILKEIREAVGPEVARQSQRFGFPESTTEWAAAIEKTDNFLRLRPEIFCRQTEAFRLPPVHTTEEFLLFPNPTHGTLNIQSTRDTAGWTDCEVYDRLGRKVLTQKLLFLPQPSISQLHLENLPAGTYSFFFPPSATPYRVVIY